MREGISGVRFPMVFFVAFESEKRESERERKTEREIKNEREREIKNERVCV